MHAQPCLTLMNPWTLPREDSLFMGFSRLEYWDGLPFPSPGHLPNPGIKRSSPALAGRYITTMPPGKLPVTYYIKRRDK